ncbi:MAG TPA: hypothetical protein VF124_10140 [Gaiellaceae bacterium]
MVRGRTAALSAAFAIVAIALVGAGCGGGSSNGALSLDPVAAAATKTQNAGAARIRLNMAISAQGKTVKVHASGAMDGTSVEMSFKLGSLLGLSGLPSAAKSKLHGTMQEIALEEDGDYVIYMKIPFLASQLPGGQPWVKLDVSKLGKSAGVDLGKLMSGSQVQPTDLLSTLKSDGATIHKVGSATIDGTATTQYRVTVDMAQALKSKGLTSPLLKSAVAHVKSINENVWIGKDGLVRRIAFVYGLPQGGSSQMTMDFYDYGAHTDIAAPPSNEVFDATQLAQQGLAGATH